MIEFRLLRSKDDRSSFKSGNIDLDRFFQRFAGQNQFRHHIGVTWVAAEKEKILGYATVSASQIEIEDLPATRRKKLSAYPLPVLRLARLAVDERAQGMGIGKKLLCLVLEQALDMADRFGCVGVVVDAKPEAIEFYQKLGFELISEVLEGQLHNRPQPHPMFLPLKAIPSKR